MECKDGLKNECRFPQSAYLKICSKQTFHKAKTELIENGFITEFSFRTIANIYRLSDDWKLDIIPQREPEYHDICEFKRGVKKLDK